MKNTIFVLSFLGLIVGCKEHNQIIPLMVPAATNVTTRITVIRIGQFEDNLAYDNWRGVYLINDNKTGKEYIGISGIGISESGSHQAGKTREDDER